MSSTATEKWEQTALEHLVRSPAEEAMPLVGTGEGRVGAGRSEVSAAGETPFPRGFKTEGKQVRGHASEKERGNLKQQTQEP